MFQIEDYKWSPVTLKPNLKQIPITNLEFCEEDVKVFNEACEWCEQQGMGRIAWTPSGGIKKNGPSNKYGFLNSSSRTDLVIGFNNKWARICIGYDFKKGAMWGTQAFKKFKEVLKKFDIDINDYKIENGEAIHNSMPKPIIEIARPEYMGKTVEHVYHIDLNSSYVSGMAFYFPSLHEGIKYMYEKRKESPEFKNVLAITTGYMHSMNVGHNAAWAHLAYAGLSWNNQAIIALREELERRNYEVILINTDGLWFKAEDKVENIQVEVNFKDCKYAEEKGEKFLLREGKGLGEFKIDHKDCTFRAKSKGAYEFIEDGVYNVKLRGQTNYDKIQPDRSKWQWGDIYRKEASTIIKYKFDTEKERIL